MTRLNGLYLTGEDVGITLEDLAVLRSETPYVITLPEELGGVGPIAPPTAVGVIEGMEACLREAFGSDSFVGRAVAVQGVGAVGGEVVRMLVESGATVTATDIDAGRLADLANAFGVATVAPEAIYDLEADVFSPCALGATLNADTLPRIRARVIAGCANNQLADPSVGDEIHRRGLIYAPDYVINAGGATIDADRLGPGGFNRERAMASVRRIGERIAEVLRISREEGIPTYVAADRFAERRLAAMRSVNAIATGPRWPAIGGEAARR